MRKETWIRLGLLTSFVGLGIAATLGPASITGCSGDDNTTGSSSGSSSGGKVDSGSSSGSSGGGSGSSSGSGSGSGGGSGSSSGGTTLPDAKLVIMHAAPSGDGTGLGPVRLCLSQGTAADGSDQKVAQLPPLPHTVVPQLGYPGLPNGTGAGFPDVTDLSPVVLRAYILRADNALVKAHSAADGVNEPDCTKFIGNKGDGSDADPALKLTLNKDYYQLPLIPAQTFVQNNTFMVAITGCPGATGDAGTLSTALCGSGWTAGTGNLGASIVKVDTTFDAGTGFGAQFLQRSTAIEGLPATADTTAIGGGKDSPVHAPASAGVIPTFLFDVDGGDEAGTVTQASPLSATPVTFSPTQITPNPAITPAGVSLADPTTKFGVITMPGGGDGGTPVPSAYPGGDFFALPLPVIQLTTTGNAPPPYGDAGALMFQNGETYTFVLVGDPTKTFGAVVLTDAGTPTITPGNTPLEGLHFLAFPNHIVVPTSL